MKLSNPSPVLSLRVPRPRRPGSATWTSTRATITTSLRLTVLLLLASAGIRGEVLACYARQAAPAARELWARRTRLRRAAIADAFFADGLGRSNTDYLWWLEEMREVKMAAAD